MTKKSINTMNAIVINNEECRIIVGFERYHVSESGRIYRTRTLMPSEEKKIARGALFITEKKIFFKYRKGILQQGFVSLGDSNGKLHMLPVATLVARAFEIVPNCITQKKYSFGYKDGNKKNLHYTNLHIISNRRLSHKLSYENVKEIKKLLKQGESLKKIGDAYGVSDMQIHRIKTGENWGNGKRKIKAPVAPFEVENGRMRRYIAMFESQKTSKNIKKPFSIKRNPEDPTDNVIIGIINGYKLTMKHSNITRAKSNIEKLNKYFFRKEKIAEEKKIEIKNINDLFKHDFEKEEALNVMI